jgi:hypothetical protein
LQSKGDLIESFKSKGAKIVYGDLQNFEDVQKAATGIEIVICLLPMSLFDGETEKKIIKAASSVGVKRFVPNQFTSDYTKIAIEDSGLFAKLQRSVVQAIQDAGMEFTVIFTATWFPFAFNAYTGVDIDNGAITLIEGGNYKISAISIEDVGRFVPEILLDNTSKNRYIRLEGATFTRRQLKTLLEETFEKKFTSTEISLVNNCKSSDHLGRLSQTITRKRNKSDNGIHFQISRMGNQIPSICFDGRIE